MQKSSLAITDSGRHPALVAALALAATSTANAHIASAGLPPGKNASMLKIGLDHPWTGHEAFVNAGAEDIIVLIATTEVTMDTSVLSPAIMAALGDDTNVTLTTGTGQLDDETTVTAINSMATTLARNFENLRTLAAAPFFRPAFGAS